MHTAQQKFPLSPWELTMLRFFLCKEPLGKVFVEKALLLLISLWRLQGMVCCAFFQRTRLGSKWKKYFLKFWNIIYYGQYYGCLLHSKAGGLHRNTMHDTITLSYIWGLHKIKTISKCWDNIHSRWVRLRLGYYITHFDLLYISAVMPSFMPNISTQLTLVP